MWLLSPDAKNNITKRDFLIHALTTLYRTPFAERFCFHTKSISDFLRLSHCCHIYWFLCQFLHPDFCSAPLSFLYPHHCLHSLGCLIISQCVNILIHNQLLRPNLLKVLIPAFKIRYTLNKSDPWLKYNRCDSL